MAMFFFQFFISAPDQRSKYYDPFCNFGVLRLFRGQQKQYIAKIATGISLVIFYRGSSLRISPLYGLGFWRRENPGDYYGPDPFISEVIDEQQGLYDIFQVAVVSSGFT